MEAVLFAIGLVVGFVALIGLLLASTMMATVGFGLALIAAAILLGASLIAGAVWNK